MDKQPKTVDSYLKTAKCPHCGSVLVVRTGPMGSFGAVHATQFVVTRKVQENYKEISYGW